MPDRVKEKLVELLRNAKAAMKAENLSCDIARNMFVVDFMMANDVTVQEWISVKDRLPEKNVLVLCVGARGGMFLGISPTLFSDGTAHFGVPNARNCRYATYWMPLPEPPKEEWL